MADDAEERTEILARGAPAEKIAQEIIAQQHRADGLEHVERDDHGRALRAVIAVKIRQPRVAAAMAAHVVVKHGADADGTIMVAEKIGDKGGNEDSLEHHSSSLSPRCRMVMRMGVPFRPKTSRIWFSR